MYIFLSPHFDDAIGSAGGSIQRLVQSGEKCCVMTIMAAVPWSRPKHAVYERSKQQLFSAEVTEHGLIKEISNYLLTHTKPEDILIAPVGLGNHIDHRIVNLAVRNIDRKVYFYEEFFYDADGKISPLTADYQYILLSQDEIAKKIDAMMKYKKTLRKLFGKNWQTKMNDYFTNKRIKENKSYERFNKISFFNGK